MERLLAKVIAFMERLLAKVIALFFVFARNVKLS